MEIKKTIKTGRLSLLGAALMIIISLTACDALHVLTEDEFFIEKYNIDTETMSPARKAVTYSPSSLLKWASVAAAVSYDLQLSGDEEFGGTLLVDLSGLTSAEYQIPNLPGYGRYFWRMRTNLDDGNTSQWFKYAFSYLSSDTFEHFEQFTEGGFSTLQEWILGGDIEPAIQDEEFFDGFHAVGMGSINNTGDSTMSIDIYLESSKILSFYYMKTDDNSNFSFSVDGYTKINNKYEATEGWVQYTTLLSEGSHTLKWRDSNYSYNNDFPSTDENVLFVDSIKLLEVPEFVNDGFETVDGVDSRTGIKI
ncbi:MAG: hypothetical protein JEZ04_22565 [Spirochaetales bacterium]|nr:hypothetical protein [Spirochaetales bacterium]